MGGETVETFDVDMTARDGTSMPARIINRVRFGEDGRAGDSRSLVLNRQPGHDISEDLRVAEVRFARFFYKRLSTNKLGERLIGRGTRFSLRWHQDGKRQRRVTLGPLSRCSF